MDLSRLLRPRSVAVVGATERPDSYGAQALLNLRAIGYPGPVWGVNPRRTEVLGRPCVPTIADLPEPADAVVVAIPAPGVPAAVEEAGARGCGGAVVISAGFAEVAGGVSLQRELVAAAERHEIPVCGPNCNGIVAMHARTALWGDALAPREPGAVALISQSGNVAVNALATRRGLRFHTVVASGNQAVLTAADYLTYLAGSAGLGSIALYLEDDGGPGLCDGLAACAENGVRVAVLKVGSSRAGADAAAAHSGALAGDQRIFRALIEEAGGLWADDVHELLELAKTLAVSNPTRRPRPDAGAGGLAIMTCSGGDSAQGADEAERLGLDLPAFAPATCARLREVLPSAATAANPLDYTAMIWGDTDALSELVQASGSDPAINRVLVFYDQPPDLTGAIKDSWDAVREGIVAGAARSPARTIVSSTLPELLDDAAAWDFIQAGIPAVAGLRTGLRCARALGHPAGDPGRLHEIAAAALAANGATRDPTTRDPATRYPAAGDPTTPDPTTRAPATLDAVPAPGPAGEWLSEHDAKNLLRAAGVSVIEGRLVGDEDDAVLALAEFGGNVAAKLSDATVQHKSELGAVCLGLRDEADVRSAYRRLSALGGNVLVERMATPGVELFVAAHTDAVVPALVIGLGGVWTEVMDDVAIVPLPASAARVERALRSLRGAPLLTGGRGGTPVDIGAAARLAARVGEVLIEDALELIELNPVLVSPDGAVALDATARRRMPLPTPAPSSTPTPVGTAPCTT
jgi:acetate---CoA ligase (ADP-forming)